MKWILILVIYQAPPDAVNWNGPWTIGLARSVDEHFASEADCRRSAAERIARLHQGMLAPVRFRCVPVEADLPVGAPR
jgi:hypothetical protein